MALFIIKKYVLAKDVLDAIKKEKKYPVTEVFLDDESYRKLVFEKQQKDTKNVV